LFFERWKAGISLEGREFEKAIVGKRTIMGSTGDLEIAIAARMAIMRKRSGREW
jgi:hypothetical protein